MSLLTDVKHSETFKPFLFFLYRNTGGFKMNVLVTNATNFVANMDGKKKKSEHNTIRSSQLCMCTLKLFYLTLLGHTYYFPSVVYFTPDILKHFHCSF